ncbi:MAG: hypothetical protein HGA75_10030 [Thiobacillus sp.]|nr:hypothetical protein [Thiobacillus sp.]
MRRLAAWWLACLASGLVHAQATPGLALYLADPPRPGILSGCELFFFARTEGQPWHRVTRPVRLEWEGGGAALNAGEANGGKPDMLREHCFRLELDGRILTGGAVISSHSARYLAFPVLLEPPLPDGGIPVLTLRPHWTADGDGCGLGIGRVLEALRRRFP